MQQRYYDPIAGRFLSVDPVVTNANSGKSFGRYHYAEGNPYKYKDPDGRAVETVVDMAVAAYDGGKFLGAAAAWAVGKITGDASLASVGAEGMRETGRDAGLSLASVVVPGVSSGMLKAGDKALDAAKGAGAAERTGANQMQKAVEKGQAPKGVERVDKAHDAPGAKDHVHFKNGTSMNHDGTIHDAHKGTPSPTNKESKWLETNGWTGKPEQK